MLIEAISVPLNKWKYLEIYIQAGKQAVSIASPVGESNTVFTSEPSTPTQLLRVDQQTNEKGIINLVKVQTRRI